MKSHGSNTAYFTVTNGTSIRTHPSSRLVIRTTHENKASFIINFHEIYQIGKAITAWDGSKHNERVSATYDEPHHIELAPDVKDSYYEAQFAVADVVSILMQNWLQEQNMFISDKQIPISARDFKVKLARLDQFTRSTVRDAINKSKKDKRHFQFMVLRDGLVDTDTTTTKEQVAWYRKIWFTGTEWNSCRIDGKMRQEKLMETWLSKLNVAGEEPKAKHTAVPKYTYKDKESRHQSW